MSDIESGLKDIAAIRGIMERSSRFLSLSGVSGVAAGVVALLAAWVARGVLGAAGEGAYEGGFGGGLARELMLLGLATLSSALALSWFFSRRMAAKRGEIFWGPAGRHAALALGVPVAAGAAVTLVLLGHGQVWALPGCTLVFYGLGLFSAGSFTFGEIRILGLLELLLGILALAFPGAGLLLWAAGFGALHIAYGIYLYAKYER